LPFLKRNLRGIMMQKQNKKKREKAEDAEITDWFLAIDACLA
jgi:hypothetical protein